MTKWLKTTKSPSFIFFVSIIVIAVTVGISSHSYFTGRVFKLELDTYKFQSEHDSVVTYGSSTAAPIHVQTQGQQRTVTIQNMEYVVTKEARVNYDPQTFDVSYPEGHRYEVSDLNGMLLSSNEKGEFVSDVTIYADDRRILAEGEERFTPAALVTAAFPEYHYKRGAPVFLYLALGLMVYGWSAFRYVKFQNFLFKLNLYKLWIEGDPEPSWFYYFMCKVGGIVVMIFSIYVASKAY